MVEMLLGSVMPLFNHVQAMRPAFLLDMPADMSVHDRHMCMT